MTRVLMKKLVEEHFKEELEKHKDNRDEKIEELTDKLMKEHGSIENAREHFKDKAAGRKPGDMKR